jgi:hypothetical protein
MGTLRSLDDLLAQALARPQGRDRERWIATTCGEDAALELELRRLLAAHESAECFMTEPASVAADGTGRHQKKP